MHFKTDDFQKEMTSSLRTDLQKYCVSRTMRCPIYFM